MKTVNEVSRLTGLEKLQHINLLTLKKEHIENLIIYARGIHLMGVKDMDFPAFDTKKMYVGGGSMTENIDKAGGKGTAEFVSKAIEIYCK